MCDASKGYIQRARREWPKVRLGAAYIVSDVNCRLLRRLNQIILDIPASEDNYEYISADFPPLFSRYDEQEAAVRREEEEKKRLSPAPAVPLPPMTLAFLEAFRYHLVTAIFNYTPENPNPASQYGGEEARFF